MQKRNKRQRIYQYLLDQAYWVSVVSSPSDVCQVRHFTQDLLQFGVWMLRSSCAVLQELSEEDRQKKEELELLVQRAQESLSPRPRTIVNNISQHQAKDHGSFSSK